MKNESLNAIGDRAKLARSSAKLSQSALAAAGGPSRPTLSRIERGKPVESLDSQLQRIAMVCRVSIEWLQTGQGPMKIAHLVVTPPTEEPNNLLAAENSVPYHLDPHLDAQRMRSVIEITEEYLAELAPKERPSPARIANLILKLYEIEAEASAPIPLMRQRILPIVQTLRVG